MGRKRHTPERIITALREAEVGLARGKSVKLISRELGITEQTYYSHDVLEVLADLFVRHGPPEYLRSDNRPEFTAKLVRRWLGRVGVETLFTRAGQPVGERLQRELQRQAQGRAVEREIFYSLAEAAGLVEQWRREYNTVRPTAPAAAFPRPLRRLSRRPWFPEDARPSRPSTGAGTNIGCGTALGGKVSS